ncbi:MAG: transposase [Ktedonobacterales bacterium]|nr:transposase [Ktedonobacterales bacterium]
MPSTPVYCYRRSTAQSQQKGWTVNRKTVACAMREMRLVGLHPGPNMSKRDHAASTYPYLLRHTTVAYPNHIWGVDMTEVGGTLLTPTSRSISQNAIVIP